MPIILAILPLIRLEVDVAGSFKSALINVDFHLPVVDVIYMASGAGGGAIHWRGLPVCAGRTAQTG